MRVYGGPTQKYDWECDLCGKKQSDYEEIMRMRRSFCRMYALSLASWFRNHKDEIAQKSQLIIGHNRR